MSTTDPLRVADCVFVAVAAMPTSIPVSRPDRPPPGAPTWRTREYLAARVELRALLAETVGAAAASARITKRESGQPYLSDLAGVEISIAHSEHWIAVGVGLGSMIGVDVQEASRAPRRLLRRCCRPSTLAALDRLAPAARDLEFARIWTVQEACVKASGGGFAEAPWTIPVDVDQNEGSWQDMRWISIRGPFPVPVACAFTPITEGG